MRIFDPQEPDTLAMPLFQTLSKGICHKSTVGLVSVWEANGHHFKFMMEEKYCT